MSESKLEEERQELLERLEKSERLGARGSRKRGRERALELAAKQGIKQIRSMTESKADFWPEEESIDEFLSWLDDLRHNDQTRSIPE